MRKILALVLCLAIASTMFAVPSLAFTKETITCDGVSVFRYDFGNGRYSYSGRFLRMVLWKILTGRCPV